MTKLSVRYRLDKAIRVVRFLVAYYPQLIRVLWGMLLNRKDNADDDGTARVQRVQAYFGPLYIIRDDPGVRAVRKKGYYDLTLTVALERYLKPGMTMMDVGANVGYFAAIAAKRTASPVLCVEPDPRCIDVLTRNKEFYPQLRIFPYAASDRAGMETFIMDERSTGDSSLYSSAVGTPIQVQTATLDGLFPQEHIDVMVIDAQGAEPRILAGAEKLLQRTSKIFFEFWPYGLELAGFKAEDMLSFLDAHGFDLSHFFPSFHPDPLHPAELVESLKRQDRGRGFCNLLASRRAGRSGEAAETAASLVAGASCSAAVAGV